MNATSAEIGFRFCGKVECIYDALPNILYPLNIIIINIIPIESMTVWVKGMLVLYISFRES